MVLSIEQIYHMYAYIHEKILIHTKYVVCGFIQCVPFAIFQEQKAVLVHFRKTKLGLNDGRCFYF